jgi:hydrogenase maturation protein HypF
MLPYTPLQHLIFHEAAGRPSHNMYASAAQSFVLVMTSANPGGEPLVIENTEAASRLGGIADSIVTHNRDIIIRVDDSVTRVVNGAPYFIRRARGYVPESIKLPYAVPCTLAFGADLKNTICITRGNEAFVSQHIGDIDNAKTVEFLHETVQHLLSILAVKPERIACDLHPDFHTSRLAASWNLPTIRVQHHHAHAASVAVEHGITTPVLGVALDGFGLGTDGTLWGGELLHVKGAQFERLGHFRPLAEPGGDKAAREPWRMAAAALHDMGRGHEIAARFSKIPLASALANMLDAGINSPKTSSCGRLFDAACGLAGVKDVALYEGEAPMLFESLVRATRPIHELWSISPTLELDWRPLLAHIAEESTPQSAAEIFHGTLVGGLTEWVLKGAERSQAQTVVLCGGCFLNHILVSELSKSLEARGLRVLVPRVLPPNDGGISLGQAWIAALTSH